MARKRTITGLLRIYMARVAGQFALRIRSKATDIAPRHLSSGRGVAVKKVLRTRPADLAWSGELAAIRDLVQTQHRR